VASRDAEGAADAAACDARGGGAGSVGREGGAGGFGLDGCALLVIGGIEAAGLRGELTAPASGRGTLARGELGVLWRTGEEELRASGR
jgi:hypothetical protein